MTVTRYPRDSQRRRVYLAETPHPGRKLRGLPGCEDFRDLVVTDPWWGERFPEHTPDLAPMLRPGQGARHAFFRWDTAKPSITLPRRYRHTSVVLHELTHWALHGQSDLPHHGRTFVRVLLDATRHYDGDAAADALERSFTQHNVHLAHPARCGPDGRLRYGWDERIRLSRGRYLSLRYASESRPDASVTGRLEGPARRGRAVKVQPLGAVPEVVLVDSVWDVQPTPDPHTEAELAGRLFLP